MRMKNALGSSRRKIATNLSVRADLTREAKALGINLSEVFEEALLKVVRRRREEHWRQENREAIEDYNAAVAREGIFSDVSRSAASTRK
jgi:antitoxin CcdA